MMFQGHFQIQVKYKIAYKYESLKGLTSIDSICAKLLV